jgi:hypothetical protein
MIAAVDEHFRLCQGERLALTNYMLRFQRLIQTPPFLPLSPLAIRNPSCNLFSRRK